jgi:tetratricopeptide (TPR) repeat protein
MTEYLNTTTAESAAKSSLSTTFFRHPLFLGVVAISVIGGAVWYTSGDKKSSSNKSQVEAKEDALPTLPPLPGEPTKALTSQQAYTQRFADLKTTLEKAEKDKKDEALGKALYNLVHLHEQMNMPIEEMGYLTRLLEVNTRLDHKESMVSNYNRMGYLHLINDKTDEAIADFTKALELNEQRKNKEDMAISHHNLAQAYMKAAKPAKASRHFVEALQIYSKLGDIAGLADTYHALARLYFLGGRYDEAEEFQVAALELNIKTARKNSILENYMMLGSIYKAKHDAENGCKSWSEALKMVDTPKAMDYTNNPQSTKDYLQGQLTSPFCAASGKAGFGLQ